MGSIQNKLKEIDGWLRNRLGTVFGKTGRKLNERKRILSGSEFRLVRPTHGVVAQSPIMVTTITLIRLIQWGYESLFS